MITTAEIPDTIAADAAQVGRMLTLGGYADITVRSRATGEHVTLTFTCKKRGENGRFISRATKAGRVGLLDADVIFIDRYDELVASYNPHTGLFRHARASTPATRWTAEKLLAWIQEGFPIEAQAEVVVATRCACCHRKLTDPESVARGLGPECAGRPTGSKAAH